ncbi:MAP kinase, partial [Mucidula mucida]
SDPSGALNFEGKASIDASGVNFSNGASFSVKMEDFEQLGEELGRGNYGTVMRVLYRPKKLEMAMKQIPVELESSKFKTIIMELNILHQAVAPSIIKFYGAFYTESCVHLCVEYMDAGSLDKLTAFTIGLPEEVLSRILGSTIRGLKFLKDKLEVIHRDVKPTNILANSRGQIKLCDFGVSGQLQKSIANTMVGCQTYMAPERILANAEGYGVASDVWSVGISALEIAMGKYPYENRTDIMAYMNALVRGDVPVLPDSYSPAAREWVANCLIKDPEQRAGFQVLLAHPFIQEQEAQDIDMLAWVATASKFKEGRAAAKAS